MKFSLAIIPTFFALSTFGSPIELNARQSLKCHRCIHVIAAPAFEVGTFCAEKLSNLNPAKGQGKPLSQADQINFFSKGFKCVSDSMEWLDIPLDCLNCLQELVHKSEGLLAQIVGIKNSNQLNGTSPDRGMSRKVASVYPSRRFTDIESFEIVDYCWHIDTVPAGLRYIDAFGKTLVDLPLR